ncbi:NmrA family NAD(P)-binding protein [Williamsia serinedens]|nr:NAD(P)H-binding protein [Williamsia serinedens]
MIQNAQASPVVVTGATGRVGRPLVDELSRRGHPVRAVARDPMSTSFASGVDVAASALDAVRGAGAVFKLSARRMQASSPRLLDMIARRRPTTLPRVGRPPAAARERIPTPVANRGPPAADVLLGGPAGVSAIVGTTVRCPRRLALADMAII